MDSYYQYYRTIAQMAVAETKAFWTAHKIATILPAPVIGFLISTVLTHGLHSWRQLLQAVVLSVLGFLAALTLTFMVSLARSPKLLDDKQNDTIRSLAKPPHTALQEYRLQTARSAIERHGQNAIILLRHLRAVGKITFDLGNEPNLPAGIGADATQKILTALKVDSIVEEELVYPPPVSVDPNSPRAMIEKIFYHSRTKHVWRIIPEMVDTIDELL